VRSERKINSSVIGLNPQSASTHEILRDAFKEAKAIFSAELTQDECMQIWLGDKSSMTDVLDVIVQSKLKYDSRPTSKARKWLAIFSEKVIYYGTVLDVLVQQYPEYVSLAWGTMKFLFMVRLRLFLLSKKFS
jgi:hypothetical protein